MINRPQTIANEITDALNAFVHESDRLRDWNSAEIQACLREVEKLQKVADARAAFCLFGGVAAICGEVDRLFEYFRKAQLLPGEAESNHEFWLSMANAGLHARSQELGGWLLDPKRGFFPTIWELAVSRGQIREVWRRLVDAKRTYPELSKIDFSTLENAVAVMDEHGLSDQNVVSVLDLMGEIQRKHRIMFSGSDVVSHFRVMHPPEGESYLYFTIPLDTDVGEIHAMNRELAKLIVERLPDGAFPQGMTASFSKAEAQDLRVAA